MYKKIIILIIALILINSTQTVQAEIVSYDGNPPLPCKWTDMKNKIGTPFSDINNDRAYDTMILSRLCELEAKSANLESRVKQLESQEQTAQVVKETIVVQDNAKVEALEKRVSLLEKAVSSIQTVVLSAINKAIEILEKLLK